MAAISEERAREIITVMMRHYVIHSKIAAETKDLVSMAKSIETAASARYMAEGIAYAAGLPNDGIIDHCIEGMVHEWQSLTDEVKAAVIALCEHNAWRASAEDN